MKRLIRMLEDYQHCSTCDRLRAGQTYEAMLDDNYWCINSPVISIVFKYDENRLFKFVEELTPLKTSQAKHSFLSVLGKR